jgi:hypothetical protein
LHRALAPGGHLLLAFQLGDDVNHDDEAFGHRVDLDFHRMRPDLLDGSPFDVRASLTCAAEGTEPTPQASLLARRRD